MSDLLKKTNQSGSRQGTLRGLHYQIKHAQGKLIRVRSGNIFDVAVNFRHDSPTFGRWVGVELTADSKEKLWIPAMMKKYFLKFTLYSSLLE